MVTAVAKGILEVSRSNEKIVSRVLFRRVASGCCVASADHARVSANRVYEVWRDYTHSVALIYTALDEK